MKSYIISEQLAQKVITYLAGKPFAEVVELINGLTHLTQKEENNGEDNRQTSV